MNDIIRISKLNEVYIHVDCEPGVAFELADKFTFMVPDAKFHPLVKNKVWDGKIRLFNVMTKQLYAGLLHEVLSFARAREYEVEFLSDFDDVEYSLSEGKEFSETLGLPFPVRDYQLESFTHAVRKSRGMVLSPTASGKSLIIYLLTRYYNARTLIIVPTVSLVLQLASDFASYGLDVDSFVHCVSGGSSPQTDSRIVISTWQSIYKLPAGYFKPFDLVIGDEAHLFKAKSLTSIMTKLTQCKYRFGFTGTLDGTETNKLVLEGLFGKVHRAVSTADLIDQKHLADLKIKALVLKYPEEIRKQLKKLDYQAEMDFIVRYQSRNKFIKNLALSLSGNILLLYQYVDKHGKELYDLINSPDRKVFFIHGGVSGDERERIRKLVEEESNAIIIASSGTFSTGVNIKNLHNIIFASPSKSKIKNLQSIGRGLRKSETKDSVTLYDIADDLSWKTRKNYTLEHFKERIKIYSEEGFDYKIYNIQLKE